MTRTKEKLMDHGGRRPSPRTAIRFHVFASVLLLAGTSPWSLSTRLFHVDLTDSSCGNVRRGKKNQRKEAVFYYLEFHSSSDEVVLDGSRSIRTCMPNPQSDKSWTYRKMDDRKKFVPVYPSSATELITYLVFSRLAKTSRVSVLLTKRMGLNN